MIRAVIIAVGLLVVPPEELKEIAGPAAAVDGDTIVIAGQPVRLWGIDAPEADQTCQDLDGEAWPCGQYAKQILANLVSTASVICVPQGLNHDGVIVAYCTSEGRDLAWAMVAFGFAVDVPEMSGGAYRDPQAQSAAVKAGIWSGTIGDAPKSH